MVVCDQQDLRYQNLTITFLLKRSIMKKFLLTLLAWSVSLAAQTGSQPLFISNITINPSGCVSSTTNISAIAAGGTPSSAGNYTYTIVNSGLPFSSSPIVAPTATFTVPVFGEFTKYDLIVTDTLNNQITYSILPSTSQTKSVSLSINSLPLGDGPGCFTLSVTDPGGQDSGEVSFEVQVEDTELNLIHPPITVTAHESPFERTFSAFPLPKNQVFHVFITTSNDCNNPNPSFEFLFPFPQGMSNALKAYIFNKYCSCALLSTTIPTNQ